MTQEEARKILEEHGRYMRREGEYMFAIDAPPYPIEKVREAEEQLDNL